MLSLTMIQLFDFLFVLVLVFVYLFQNTFVINSVCLVYSISFNEFFWIHLKFVLQLIVFDFSTILYLNFVCVCHRFIDYYSKIVELKCQNTLWLTTLNIFVCICVCLNMFRCLLRFDLSFVFFLNADHNFFKSDFH